MRCDDFADLMNPAATPHQLPSYLTMDSNWILNMGFSWMPINTYLIIGTQKSMLGALSKSSRTSS